MTTQINFSDESLEWVERWLDIWARDMRDPDLRLSFPNRASGFIGGGYGENRDLLDDWQSEGESTAIGVIDATLRDLPAVESAAVMHVKLRARFAFACDPAAPYQSALEKIGIRLRAAALC